MIIEAGADGEDDTGTDADVEVGADAEIFFSRSLSFCDIYSNTDRGADGRGVSPSNAPRFKL
jgi:hypothetical protein